MNPCSDPSTSAKRRAWMAVLARASRSELGEAMQCALAGQAPPSYDWLRGPEIGLAMVRGRIGGTGDPFNLGEATVTRATLKLRPAPGQEAGAVVGVACLLGRDKRRAELAALADALLQIPACHARMQATVIEPLAARQAQVRTRRAQDTASTRVEFFTMVRGD